MSLTTASRLNWTALVTGEKSATSLLPKVTLLDSSSLRRDTMSLRSVLTTAQIKAC